MNKAIRVISILMLTVLVVSALSMPVLAFGSDALDWVDPNAGTTDISGVENLMNSIINIVQIVGSGVAVVMLMYLAIKYLTSAPEGKAEIKKTAIPYVIGAVILFAAVNILRAIAEMAESLEV